MTWPEFTVTIVQALAWPIVVVVSVVIILRSRR